MDNTQSLPVSKFKGISIKFLVSASLVAGTSIGAGMLGLPVDTARSGYLPALLSYLICWLTMCTSGIYFLSALSKCNKGSNFIGMAGSIFGKKVLPFIWLLYGILLYSLLLVYIKGLVNFFQIFPLFQSSFISHSAVLAIFIPCLFVGPRLIGNVNSLLTFGLIISFIILLSCGFSQFSIGMLSTSDWFSAPLSIPIILTAFGYHPVIPTIYRYLDYDLKKTKLAIIVGTLTTFCIYLIWQTFIMGVVPTHQLLNALANDLTAIYPLQKTLNNPLIHNFGHLFSFFAFATSFIGISISLFDFLADELTLEKSYKSITCLLICMFVPPIIFSSLNVQIFYWSLRYGAGITVTLLLILLPALMIYKQQKQHSSNILARAVTIYLFVFALIEISIECIHLFV